MAGSGPEPLNLRVVHHSDLLASRMQTLVNPVNCVGVMGKGLALEFKRRYPEMYEDYCQRCRANAVRMGEPYLYKHSPTRWILNFPTKRHWRNASRVADIETGLVYVAENFRDWGITSLAIPALGCGCGGLTWLTVEPIIMRILGRLDIPVEVYAPAVGPNGNRVCAIDFETTAEGRFRPPSRKQPLSLAIVDAQSGETLFYEHFKPERSVASREAFGTRIHGIRPKDVASCESFRSRLAVIKEVFSQYDTVVAHNMDFDGYFLPEWVLPRHKRVCTVRLLHRKYGGKYMNLRESCTTLGIEFDGDRHHSARYDATKAGEIYRKL